MRRDRCPERACPGSAVRMRRAPCGAPWCCKRRDAPSSESFNPAQPESACLRRQPVLSKYRNATCPCRPLTSSNLSHLSTRSTTIHRRYRLIHARIHACRRTPGASSKNPLEMNLDTLCRGWLCCRAVTASTGGLPPLAGYRVIDFGHYLAGPLAGMLLADQGAEVIKVDRPGHPVLRHARGRRVQPRQAGPGAGPEERRRPRRRPSNWWPARTW